MFWGWYTKFMQCVILAAGKGKRLRPLTKNMSKAMTPILDIPIVGRIAKTILKAGIKDFLIVKSPKDSYINEYFARVEWKNVKIEFTEQKEAKGMAHALKMVSPHIKKDFILTACDSLIEEQDVKRLIKTFRQDKKNKAVLGLEKVEEKDITNSGIVDFDLTGRIKRIIEKPTLEEAPTNINAIPFYVFSKRVIPYIEKVTPSIKGEYLLQDAIQFIINDHGSLRGNYVSSRHSITKVEDVKKVNLALLKGIEIKRKITNCKITSPVHIGPGEEIVDCEIGPNVYIESGATLAQGTSLANTVVLKGLQI